MVAAVLALSAILARSSSAQTGGTPVPGPGDPCPAVYPGDDAEQKAIARLRRPAMRRRSSPASAHTRERRKQYR
jgi:hypothetical protein